jgi:4-hydroxyproline epimerase
MNLTEMESLRVIDSHTAGEPTRVVLEGGIPLVGATMVERREDFRTRFDHFRTALINEPRGAPVLVGAVLTPPITTAASAGIVFFNNAGYIGMCGHGTIGVVETLKHVGRLQSGSVTFDTPVGTVSAELHANGEVSLRNVLSYRHLAGVRLSVEGVGDVLGDVAYGGNWFFIVHSPTFDVVIERASELTYACLQIKNALVRNGITGDCGAEIDHIELAGPPHAVGANSRNFVLCPGGEYDRSPCGTGTSAKLAALFSAGEIAEREVYVQESISGGIFRGSVEPEANGVRPTIVGRAYVTAESTLIFAAEDPFRWGLV